MFMEKEKLKKLSRRGLFFVICLILFSCASTVNQNYFSNTLGLNVKIQKKVFDSSDAINPQGEGYSIEALTFKNEEKESLFIDKANYPKPSEVRKNWKISSWQNAPLANKDVLELLFKYRMENEAMKEQIQKIKEVLNSSDNYFSYFYKDHKGYIYAVDICIVDVKNKKIYLCEIIT